MSKDTDTANALQCSGDNKQIVLGRAEGPQMGMMGRKPGKVVLEKSMSTQIK